MYVKHTKTIKIQLSYNEINTAISTTMLTWLEWFKTASYGPAQALPIMSCNKQKAQHSVVTTFSPCLRKY